MLDKWLHRVMDIGLSYSTIIILIFLSLATTMAEIFGIGVFIPIFQFIRLGGNLDVLVEDSNIWQHVIDFFSYFGGEPSLAVLLLLSFSFFTVRQILIYIRLIYTSAVMQRLIQTQQNRLFGSYIKANTSYHDSIPIGNVVNVIVKEVDDAVLGAISPLTLLVYIIMLMGYLFMLSFLSWEMTIFSTISLIAIGLMTKLWINQSASVGRNIVNANTLMSEFLISRLRSPRLVRLSGTESAEKNKFYRLTLSQRKHTVFSSILQAKTEVVLEPLIIALSLIFIYLSYGILHLQVEVIGLYLVVITRLIPVARSILKQIQSIKGKLGSMEELEKHFKAMKDSIEYDNGTEILTQVDRNIVMEKVGYRYPGEKFNALKNITIEFKTNEMTAIIGPSGSGKSTLIDLLPRLRLPTEGAIKIDGRDAKKYKLKSLRQLISYVPQSPQIFDGTVKEHILYGKSNATDKEIQEAVHLSDSKEFIDQLPQGLITILGDGAVKLSGGQRQRLDLARALVKKDTILILDEPTSNLDVESEEKFNKVLIKILQETNTTIIIVSHRLSSVQCADRIIVLNKGAVEDSGTHTELVKRKNWYSQAWKTQLK